MEPQDIRQMMTNAIANKHKYAANYGLYLGLYIAAFYLLDIIFPKSAFIHIICSIGELGMLFYAYYLIKQYREKACNGYITFGVAWSFGVWLFVYAALIMSVAHYIHFQLIQPDFIANMYNQSMLLLEEMDYPQEEMDLLTKNGIPSSIQMIFAFIWFYIIGGAFLSLLYALIVRKTDVFGKNSCQKNDHPFSNNEPMENQNNNQNNLS